MTRISTVSIITMLRSNDINNYSNNARVLILMITRITLIMKIDVVMILFKRTMIRRRNEEKRYERKHIKMNHIKTKNKVLNYFLCFFWFEFLMTNKMLTCVRACPWCLSGDEFTSSYISNFSVHIVMEKA